MKSSWDYTQNIGKEEESTGNEFKGYGCADWHLDWLVGAEKGTDPSAEIDRGQIVLIDRMCTQIKMIIFPEVRNGVLAVAYAVQKRAHFVTAVQHAVAEAADQDGVAFAAC
jgi:hypothetical protein